MISTTDCQRVEKIVVLFSESKSVYGHIKISEKVFVFSSRIKREKEEERENERERERQPNIEREREKLNLNWNSNFPV